MSENLADIGVTAGNITDVQIWNNSASNGGPYLIDGMVLRPTVP